MAGESPQVGIQMYTLRDQSEQDFLGTLAKVAEMGYGAVEFAGYFGVPAGELRRTLDKLGLKAPSAHVGLDFSSLDNMEKALSQEIEYAAELGLQYIITPAAPLPENPSAEDVAAVVPFLEKASAMVRAAGMKYGYHNHAYEFQQVDGKAIIDIWLEQIPGEHMLAEFDLGWVYRGGARPVDYVTRYAGRVPLVHIKDFGADHEETDLGQGAVDFQSVFDAAEESGILYYIVEQEVYAVSSLESAKQALDYFRRLGLA
ncbi:sugar phosphate isomerase/epimerase [Paenibacillus sp. MMS20-IR301]|uniref:sugar phosphate isomerase/epimerase family protein n=1 Tax=Paenibacillus sp. MMS20-IR301 TaxID=2895946 RepID=UPI0028E4032A|nr:sugar phosphate isomerase/epimerase [Paenibacillus sp. MMS20-IR301]WNS41786.1 sugar phosphate isomerase/epimerase [Paenibacillus sp. MMS20-IR301]